MSDLGTFCLYMATFTLSAYLFHLAMKQKKEGKHYGWLLFFAMIIPTLLAAVRYKVGTDYMNYIYSYQSVSKHTFVSWINKQEGTDKNLISLYAIGKFASLFDSQQVYFGAFTFLILLFTYLGVKDRDLEVSNFVIAFIFLTTTFVTGFNIMKQTLAMAIVFYSLVFAEKRKPLEFILLIIFASTVHVTSFVALPIYFMFGEEKPWSNLKRFFIIILSFVAIFFLPRLLAIFGGRYEEYDEYSGKEAANLTFYLNLAWTMIFVVAYGRMSKINKSNNGLIFMFVISSIFQVTGFISPFVKRISTYYSYQNFLLMGQLPCLFAKQDRTFINILLILYSVFIFILSYWILGHSDLFPFNYRF